MPSIVFICSSMMVESVVIRPFSSDAFFASIDGVVAFEADAVFMAPKVVVQPFGHLKFAGSRMQRPVCEAAHCLPSATALIESISCEYLMDDSRFRSRTFEYHPKTIDIVSAIQNSVGIRYRISFLRCGDCIANIVDCQVNLGSVLLLEGDH